MQHRVIAYIDGYNLYYGLRSKGWKRYYWLNVQETIKGLLKPGQVLVATNYFTTIVKRPEDKRRRQAVFLEALQTLDDFQIYYGHFLSDVIQCRQCGHTHRTHHEKMTDVNISVQLMTDAFRDLFDTALVVSGDSDLVGAVRAVRDLFRPKRVVIAFPPKRVSKALTQAADGHTHIGRDLLAKSVFPQTVTKPDGFRLRRPVEWR
jgi:uncharacterized LabA/DUF88 family protein